MPQAVARLWNLKGDDLATLEVIRVPDCRIAVAG